MGLSRKYVKLLQSVGAISIPFVVSSAVMGFVVLVGNVLNFPFESTREFAALSGGFMFVLGLIAATPILAEIWIGD